MSVEKHALDYVRQSVRNFRNEPERSAYDDGCQRIQPIDLSRITADEATKIIEPFLVKWGWMARVVHNPSRKGWHKLLAEKIRDHSKFLTSTRALDLSGKDLISERSEIESCYNSFRTVIGPTSAAKVLHLMAPNFFPPWDNAISELVWCSARTDSHLKRGAQRRSGSGYHIFMIQIQHFLNTYLGVWHQLAVEYNWTKVKMIDSYLWANQRPLAWFDLGEIQEGT